MAEAAANPTAVKLAFGAGKCIARAGEFERHGDVLQRGHGRNQVEGLEDDADVPAAKARQLVLIERLQALSGDDNRAAVRPLEPGHDHEQRRLAGA